MAISPKPTCARNSFRFACHPPRIRRLDRLRPMMRPCPGLAFNAFGIACAFIRHKSGFRWLPITGILSATTDCGYDRNLTSGRDRTRESTRVADVFVPDENIDVFPHLPLLSCDAISHSWMQCPERRQRLAQSCRRLFDLDSTLSSGKFSQSSRNVKSDRHGITFSSVTSVVNPNAPSCFSTETWSGVKARPQS